MMVTVHAEHIPDWRPSRKLFPQSLLLGHSHHTTLYMYYFTWARPELSESAWRVVPRGLVVRQPRESAHREAKGREGMSQAAARLERDHRACWQHVEEAGLAHGRRHHEHGDRACAGREPRGSPRRRRVVDQHQGAWMAVDVAPAATGHDA